MLIFRSHHKYHRWYSKLMFINVEVKYIAYVN